MFCYNSVCNTYTGWGVMKKTVLLLFFVSVYAYNTLWIYTNLNCDRPIEELKVGYQKYHPSYRIKILKAPLNVLIKKLETQKKADMFITDNINYVYKHPELFDIYYKKIGIKKLAILSLESKITTLNIKKRQLSIGFVSNRIYNIFMNVLKKSKGKRFYLEVKLFNKKYFYLNSTQCKKALLHGKVDVCIDWIGTGFWNKNKKIKANVINSDFYNKHYVYAVITKYSKNKLIAKEFIDYAEERFKMIGKRKSGSKIMSFLSPDLPL